MPKIAEATLVLTVDDKEYKLALNQIPKDAENAAKQVKGIAQAVDLKVFKEFGEKSAEGLKMLVDGIIELGERGANVDDVANSFEVLTEKTGETADVMLGKLREGVVGTLSDYDLMVLANKALGSGLIKTADDMAVVASGARTLAKATGSTTKEAFDTLTTAMASGRTAALKQVGLFVDSKVALEAYSGAIHKNVSDFTDSDRAQALASASLVALRNRMKEITPDAADFGELIDQAKVRIENFKDQVAVAVAKSPVFAAGMAVMGKALDSAFGSDQKKSATEMAHVIETMAIVLTYVAQGAVVVGTVFATAFSAVETVVNGVLTAIMALAAGVVTAVDSLFKVLLLTNPGPQFRATAADVDALKKNLDGMTISLAKSTAEAAKGVVGHSALHEKLDAVGGVILRVRDAMYAAQGKTADTTAAVETLGKAAPVAAGRSQEAADKIKEAFRALNDEIVAGTKVGLDRRLFEINSARDKEIASLKNLKDMTVAEHAEMERLINEKYDQRIEAARIAGDEIVNKEREVQQAIALSLTTGTENKVLQIQIQRDKEIEALEFLKAANQAQYDADVEAVKEKYRIQTEAAQGHYANIELAAAASGFKTKAELQLEADNAKMLYEQMLASGKFTYAELEAAKRKATEASIALDDNHLLHLNQNFEIIAASASTMLRAIFGKSKAAAIAAAIIDTAAAVAKTLSQYPFPFSLVPAAAAAAAGYAQIQQIRNTNAEGFAQGTPNLDFANFGTESFQPLHNQEAVIPRGGGHALAGEIAEAMPGSDEQLSLLREMTALLRQSPAEMRKAFRNAMLLDMA